MPHFITVLRCELHPSLFDSHCGSPNLFFLGPNFISMGLEDAFSSSPCKKIHDKWKLRANLWTTHNLPFFYFNLHSLLLTLVFFLSINPMFLLHPVIQANKKTGAWWLFIIPNTKTIIRGESEVYQLQHTTSPPDAWKQVMHNWKVIHMSIFPFVS